MSLFDTIRYPISDLTRDEVSSLPIDIQYTWINQVIEKLDNEGCLNRVDYKALEEPAVDFWLGFLIVGLAINRNPYMKDEIIKLLRKVIEEYNG